MRHFWNSWQAGLLMTLFAAIAGCASAPARLVESDRCRPAGCWSRTQVQEDWVRNLTPGQINPMQHRENIFFMRRTVKAARAYEAYLQLHPEYQPVTSASGMAGYVKQSDAMRKANARDLSDPWLGVGWADLIY
jgi:hypothetical protein